MHGIDSGFGWMLLKFSISTFMVEKYNSRTHINKSKTENNNLIIVHKGLLYTRYLFFGVVPAKIWNTNTILCIIIQFELLSVRIHKCFVYIWWLKKKTWILLKLVIWDFYFEALYYLNEITLGLYLKVWRQAEFWNIPKILLPLECDIQSLRQNSIRLPAYPTLTWPLSITRLGSNQVNQQQQTSSWHCIKS
jgi:hypothetical protein